MARNRLVEKAGGGRGFGIKLAGVAFVLSLAAVVAIALTMFVGGFTSTEAIYVDAPRAGLVMDKDAKVKMRGVEIGTVQSITYTGDGARLQLAITPDQLKLVPSNAGVDIASTTVFGAKYVNFTPPQQPSGESLRPGQTVDAQHVTVEFNTLFQQLTQVLAKVNPEKLNATLTALGTALQGRGDKLGQLLSDSDTYLKDINPSLPALQRDLRSTAGVGNIYGDTAPDLLRTTNNATVTSKSIVDEEHNFDLMLANLIGLANTTQPILTDNQKPLVTALDLLRPTTDLLYQDRASLPCVINAFGDNWALYQRIFGGTGQGLLLDAGFMPGGEPYHYPQDLPKVNASGPVICENLQNRVPGSHSNFRVFDTAQGEVWTPELHWHTNGPSVFQLLFAGLPGVPKP
ncbi:MCE family protein [Nocardia sp. NEAU-G5]|uniref:MCE family protein n=1 Tax=Nocardia albiluteola TaxID=2842303 RepID=A0ABS6ASX8_9NOCA|nr:MCE family protein [Nocardia albiluteola]MBU3061137.1 MCE family protein [Nocardia albiluteola]